MEVIYFERTYIPIPWITGVTHTEARDKGTTVIISFGSGDDFRSTILPNGINPIQFIEELFKNKIVLGSQNLNNLIGLPVDEEVI